MPGVLVTREGPIATITLNRPEVLNAFDAIAAASVADAIRAAADDASCRAIVLTGAGRGFCAGADLNRLREILAARDRAGARELVTNGARIVQEIVAAPKPVIAAVNGAAAGGGASLALACDIRIASIDASIGAVFNRIGLHPDLGATYFLPLIIGFGRAMELVMSGDMVAAPEAYRIGLFNQIVSVDALMAEAQAVAQKLAAKRPAAVSRAKRSMHTAVHASLEDVLTRELEQQLALVDTGDACDALLAFLEQR